MVKEIEEGKKDLKKQKQKQGQRALRKKNGVIR